MRDNTALLLVVTVALFVGSSFASWRHFCLCGPINQRRCWMRPFKTRFINRLPDLTCLMRVVVEQRWGAGVSTWGVYHLHSDPHQSGTGAIIHCVSPSRTRYSDLSCTVKQSEVEYTVLPATHIFIRTWNKPSCLYSPAVEHCHPLQVLISHPAEFAWVIMVIGWEWLQ